MVVHDRRLQNRVLSLEVRRSALWHDARITPNDSETATRPATGAKHAQTGASERRLIGAATKGELGAIQSMAKSTATLAKAH